MAAGMTTDKLIAELDKALQFPGVANSWTMPIKARIDMLSTGIRTPIGIKVFGKDLDEMERLAREIETVVKAVPGTTSAFAERITGGFYLDIVPDRNALARYGLSVGEVQDVVSAALGGEMVTTTVEGRERFGVTVRYPRDCAATRSHRPRGTGAGAAGWAAPAMPARPTGRGQDHHRRPGHPHGKRLALGLHLRRYPRPRHRLLRRRGAESGQ
jgi:hypothetical protein